MAVTIVSQKRARTEPLEPSSGPLCVAVRAGRKYRNGNLRVGSRGSTRSGRCSELSEDVMRMLAAATLE
eukprot:822469-Alexandrium_andersonii.AAC.1